MPQLRADDAIQYVKGVGPRRAAWFASLGLKTVGELLEYFPFRHEYDSGEVAIEDLQLDQIATIRGEVVDIGGRPPGLRVEVDDGTGTCVLRWFNRERRASRIFRGATIVATGKVTLYDDLPEMVQPQVQVYEPDVVLSPPQRGQRQVGVYRGNAQLKNALIRRTVLAVLQHPRLPVEEIVPAPLRAKRGLVDREQAIRDMHAPPTDAALQQARRRLAYEELFLIELAMALRRDRRLRFQAGRKLPVTPEIDQRIRARFPFPLTPAQDAAVRDIVADLGSGRPMTRLLQGDVGCGKTVVALYACLVAVAHGCQAAIMAPTEILAAQHFERIGQYLAGSRVRAVLLRGRLPARQRREALAAVEHGEMDLVVGTQALIQKDVAFNELALVVVDEQHKFGVLQRHEFRTKGIQPHYLVMTATPIPRTLGMTVLGDLDVSVIRASPPGRGTIETRVVTPAKWDLVMGYVRRRLEGGEQAYVVCPLIGEEPGQPSGEHPTADPPDPTIEPRGSRGAKAGNGRELTSVLAEHARLTQGPWRGLRVGLLHGSLPSGGKQQVIDDFAAGRLHAIVATTVVEVGVDVSAATIMIVEHADRFGLSQLHQLRGRIARSSRPGLCVLIAAGSGPRAAQRLAVMARTTDGFKIAEADLEQRGPGELFGTRQHGLPELRAADLVSDYELLEQAREDAFALVRGDPRLERREHAALLPALRRVFGDRLRLIDAA